jgi:hypothetical protein
LTICAIPTEERKLNAKMLLNFAKLQGYEDDQLRRLEDILARRAKDRDDAISDYRRLKDEVSNNNGNGKHIIAKSETELLRRLAEGWKIVQSLSEDKWLLKF